MDNYFRLFKVTIQHDKGKILRKLASQLVYKSIPELWLKSLKFVWIWRNPIKSFQFFRQILHSLEISLNALISFENHQIPQNLSSLSILEFYKILWIVWNTCEIIWNALNSLENFFINWGSFVEILGNSNGYSLLKSCSKILGNKTLKGLESQKVD